MGSAVRAILVGVLVAACSSTPTATPTPPPTLRPTATPTESPAATATVDVVAGLTTGPWRSHPIPVPDELIAPFEAGCRAAEAAIGDLPLALAELRGVKIVTLVFGAETATGYACRSTLGEPTTPFSVFALEVTGPADGIDVAWYGRIDDADASRMVTIGRVGPLTDPNETLGGPIPANVVVGLDGERFVWAAYANGWYATWWPTIEHTIGIAVMNSRNEVLDSVDPEGL